jgi:lipid II isoglutaminyl synthase (glutamine-hydrolysing)
MKSKAEKKFYITHLYPKEMSIYGDMGNIIGMKYILEKLGLEVIYQEVSIGQDLPDNTDWYFIGGGQDQEQVSIFKDLGSKRSRIIKDVKSGVGLLAICGGYQLLGEKFVTGSGDEVQGIGLFQVQTKAPSRDVKQRCTGNIVIRSLIPDLPGKFVGFENHSGQTFFTKRSNCIPFGEVISGFGNNLVEKLEGCVYKNAIGTYLHGSCLPKNIELTLWFIRNQLQRKSINFDIQKIDITISKLVNKQLIEKFS